MWTRPIAAAAALVLFATACGPSDLTETADETVTDDGLALTTTELKVATAGITVWLRPYAVKAVRNARTVWILRGRTSVNLESAFSYVPDDAFCQTNVLSARTFEIVIAVDSSSETNTLLSGLPLFVRLVQPGAKESTLKFVLEPRFVDPTGTTKIWLNTELKPIFVAGVGLTYRGKLRATGAVAGVVGGAAARLSKRAGSEDFNVDVGYDQLSTAALGSGAQFTLDLDGAPYTKRAAVAFGVNDLDLQRTPDAYQTWPSLTCTAAVQACLNTAADYEACGSYRQVTRCNIPSNLPQLGLSPDDRTQLDAALAQINAPLPANKHVTVTGFYVQAIGSAHPALTQAVKAWQQMEQTPTTLDGERTAGQLNLELDGYAARAVVPAIQKTVLQQSFKVMRLTSPKTTWELLYFTSAGRLIVVQLVDIAS